MLKIYEFSYCPYCAKVRDKLKELNLKEGEDFILIDATLPEKKQELIKLGSKSQVPFLVDENVSMYESDDIISYLESNFYRAKK